MNFLLDTNVVSEWVKPRPNAGMVKWLAEADEDRIFLSVVTLGELQYGVERLAPGERRKRLEEWLEAELKDRFEERVVGVDEEIAVTWGKLLAKLDRTGRPMGVADGFLAATAMARGMALVTRNVEDFLAVDVELVNPWNE